MNTYTLPPRWSFPQTYSRLRDDIPSVPELRAYVNHLATISGPRYVALRDFEDARQALDDALWRLAVESHRWCKRRAMDEYSDEALWWWLWSGVMARRWRLSQRRGPMPGFLPGKEIALREPGVIA